MCFGHLKVPVDQKVTLEVIIILAERVDQSLGDLEPAHVEEELEEGEYRNHEVHGVAGVVLHGVQELSAHQAGQEEGVDRQGDHLAADQSEVTCHPHPPITAHLGVDQRH